MGFLNLGSPFMRILGRLADIMILGFWSILCSLPIFTIGTSISATYYVTLKMVRDEETYITRNFFRGFKSSFKKATIVWIVILLFGLIFYINFQLMNKLDMRYENTIRNLTIGMLVIALFLGEYIFPLIARFENSVKNTIKNSMIISISNLPKSILILIVNAAPFVLINIYPKVFPFIIFFSISGVCYINSILIRSIFDKYTGADQPDEKVEEKDSNKEI